MIQFYSSPSKIVSPTSTLLESLFSHSGYFTDLLLYFLVKGFAVSGSECDWGEKEAITAESDHRFSRNTGLWRWAECFSSFCRTHYHPGADQLRDDGKNKGLCLDRFSFRLSKFNKWSQKGKDFKSVQMYGAKRESIQQAHSPEPFSLLGLAVPKRKIAVRGLMANSCPLSVACIITLSLLWKSA